MKTLPYEEFQTAQELRQAADEARGITDPLLRRLVLASKVWRLSAVTPRKERLAMVEDLDDGSLSLNNLSKLVRVSPGALSRHLSKREREGGRFAPESISSLRYLRMQAIQELPLSVPQIRSAVEAGTSAPMVARLVGVSDWLIYKLLNN